MKFTIDEAATSIRYRLDGGAYKTIGGNTTLYGLSNGSHMIRVYANDMAQNIGASEVVYFTMNTQQQEPQQAEPFLSTSELYIITIMVIVIAGITVFALSRKKKPM